MICLNDTQEVTVLAEFTYLNDKYYVVSDVNPEWWHTPRITLASSVFYTLQEAKDVIKSNLDKTIEGLLHERDKL
jgi:hypothetical protein